ncbi:hypothetical protein FEM48_Zijuj07G0171700 [Ziziphus jujuba var. spinosa]|uniref:Uncharacterized protein n=1 Tax=Ziziphus jujuba var. spinosa TaxID=714518 RepID=A0A978V5W8_ZIZJJ|nr:hypothetical protein FEM48_Zijuj07G0171700 [Ziziphus jujuba var. spinosa]
MNHISSLIGNDVMVSLQFLDLSGSGIEGPIPKTIRNNMTSFSHLDLSQNNLQGSIPRNITQLEHLDLRDNHLEGSIPEVFGNMATLACLDLGKNNFSGSIPLTFENMTSTLTHLALNCNDLEGFETMNVSNNQIRGNIADSIINWDSYLEIYLSSNQLEGGVLMFLFKATSLHLSRNNFSSINSMCNVTVDSHLSFLTMSHNQLSWVLSNCWSHFKSFIVVNLANIYELARKIPTSIGSSTRMQTLRLTNNKFIGDIPMSLKKCTTLVVMDMGDNKLLGPIPSWIGKRLQNLVILILRSNDFNGNIPSTLCHVPHLQLLDFSVNNILGKILRCLKNFRALRSSNASGNSTTIKHLYDSYNTSMSSKVRHYANHIQVIWKGILSNYGNTLRLVKSIDLSSNMLNGEIPAEITELVALISFNLSRNNLSGQIPQHIGYLKSLDSLDFSHNHFSGQIPPSLALVDCLSVLDLSNNNLSGKIPTGTQLQSFNADAYMGNIGLYGASLLKRCPREEEPIAPSESTAKEDYKDEFISGGFYASRGLVMWSVSWDFVGCWSSTSHGGLCISNS